MITTFLDFFRLPVDYLGYTKDGKLIDSVEGAIRKDCDDVIAPEFFLPYIQKHEFEALLLANFSGFSNICGDKQKDSVWNIVKKYPNPEDIIGGE